MIDADLADFVKCYNSDFRKKRIYFTNPIEWKKSSTGDKSENYLEDWYTDRNNILKACQLIKQHYTVLCAVNIGSREIILAENEQDSNGERFLCCYGERNDI